MKLQSENIHGIEFITQRLYQHAKTINSSLAAVGAERSVPLAPGQVSSPSAKGREQPEPPPASSPPCGPSTRTNCNSCHWKTKWLHLSRTMREYKIPNKDPEKCIASESCHPEARVMMTPSLIKLRTFHLALQLQSQKCSQRVSCSSKMRESFYSLHICYLTLSVLPEFVTNIMLTSPPSTCHSFIKISI